mmetsp:Transcript_38381/g.121258  ORF Transcript_38381/g.121258 Transcript_38381/m.121258 type:complete len:113 (-) Transcript_38381:243-581(-)
MHDFTGVSSIFSMKWFFSTVPEIAAISPDFWSFSDQMVIVSAQFPAGRVSHLVRCPGGGGPGGGRKFWLFDGVGLDMYSTMWLSRSMVKDHFLPSYLEALTGVLYDLNDNDD